MSDEAKPTQNNTHSRFTEDIPRNESRHRTQNIRKGRLPQRVGRDVQVVRRMGPTSGLWHTGGYPRGYRMGQGY